MNHAYRRFHRLGFVEHRRSQASKSEAESLRSYFTLLKKIQLQMAPEYHLELFLKDKLIEYLSAVNKDVDSLFMDSPPVTPSEAFNRVLSRCSHEIGVDKLVIGAEVLYTDSRYKSNPRFRNERRGKQPRVGRRNRATSLCWVCREPGHFARDRHSKAEIKAARDQGMTVKAFVATVSEDVADIVIAAELAAGEPANDEDVPNEERLPETSNSEIEVNLTHIPMPDPDVFTKATDSAKLNRNVLQVVRERADIAVFTTKIIAHEEIATQDFHSAGRFRGIIVDTACTGASITSEVEYRRYCLATTSEYKVIPANAQVSFGNTMSGSSVGKMKSLGKALIRGYLKGLDLTFDFYVFVLPSAKTPMLLSMTDLDRLGFDLHTASPSIYVNGQSEKISRDAQGRPVIQWDYGATCLLTDVELRHFHRAFGHKPADVILQSLYLAEYKDLPQDTRKQLLDIAAECESCQRIASRPRHFSVSGEHSGRFNHLVEADVLYLPDKDGVALHLTCCGTGLDAGRVLKEGASAEQLWKTFRLAWLDMYLGNPDILRVDQGSNVSKSYFTTQAAMHGIELQVIPTESPWRVGNVERHHKDILRAYLRLKLDLPHLDPESWFSMAIKANNDTVDRNGISATYAVFGAQPRPHPGLNSAIVPETAARLNAIDKARKMLEKRKAKTSVERARTVKPPFPGEHNFEVGDKVLTYRSSTGSWTGPHVVVDKTGNADITILNRETSSRVTLEASQVKRYIEQSQQAMQYLDNLRTTTACNANVDHDDSNEDIEAIANLTKVMNSKDSLVQERFKHARRKELDSLLERGVFRLEKRDTTRNYGRVFKLRYVDTLKNAGTISEYEKSRSVICGFKDKGKEEVLTRSPTVSRASTRLLLSIAASDRSKVVKIRDMDQAYTQADTNVNRLVFCEVPDELNLNKAEWILILVRPLYGLGEAGAHWYFTFQDYHTNDLNLTPTHPDQCLLYSRSQDELQAVVAVQVDETMTVGTAVFFDLENKKVGRFKHKPATTLRFETPVTFNGGCIRLSNSFVLLSQREHEQRLDSNITSDNFVCVRALGCYIAAYSRPDVLADYQLLASVTSPTSSDCRLLSLTVEKTKNGRCGGLRFVRLDHQGPLRIVMYADAGFMQQSQLGFLVVLADQHDNANILAYTSRKSRRVTRSVFAAELLALCEGFDMAAALKRQLESILNVQIDLWAVIDSKTVYNAVVRMGPVSEKRLAIHLALLRQAHCQRELSKLFWVPSEENAADPFTKRNATNSVFENFLLSNRLTLSPGAWIERQLEQEG